MERRKTVRLIARNVNRPRLLLADMRVVIEKDAGARVISAYIAAAVMKQRRKGLN